ncbi:MAG: oxygenase MpaB family protein [Pseudomonadales bacterium]|nr:oxygenase MpaB family protein [Pseudomonadales bacterium]
MKGVLLQHGKTVLVALMLVLQGCSAMKESHYVPKSPETLDEWMVEGELVLRADSTKSKSYFYFKQLGENYELAVLMDEPVGEPKAVIRGNIFEPDNETLDVIGGADAMKVAQHLQEQVSGAEISYWVRGLPVTADAVIYQKDLHEVDSIEERGWEIDYRDFMSVQGGYRLPAEIELEGDGKSLSLEVVRAETGFLTSPCAQNVDQAELEGSADGAYGYGTDADAIASLVPADGSAPLPRWIDEVDFCKQLAKVHHDKLPAPRVGLYGPDSMMWKISGLAMPAGFGAGRALLLQVAHPWVTAGIDQHSVVRDDPLGRARRTFYHILTMTYGSMPQVMASANQVRDIHEEIEGKMTEHAGAFEYGSEYRANEINAMIWVHATLWETLVYMYEDMEGELTEQEKEQFYEETKLFAMLFGIPESALPEDWDAFIEYNHAMWESPQLTVTDNAMQLKEDLFDAKSIFMIFPLWVQEIVTSANLPPRIRDQYQMKYGWWQKFNNAWIMTGANVAKLLLPKSMEQHAIYHEAEARLEGERLGGYNQRLIEAFFDKERIVN